MDASTQLLVLMVGLIIGVVCLFAQIRLFSIDKKLSRMMELHERIAAAAGIKVTWECENCHTQIDSFSDPYQVCPKCQWMKWKQTVRETV